MVKLHAAVPKSKRNGVRIRIGLSDKIASMKQLNETVSAIRYFRCLPEVSSYARYLGGTRVRRSTCQKQNQFRTADEFDKSEVHFDWRSPSHLWGGIDIIRPLPKLKTLIKPSDPNSVQNASRPNQTVINHSIRAPHGSRV